MSLESIFKPFNTGPAYGSKKRAPDGGVGVHIGGGMYIAKPNYKWSIKDKGYVRVMRRNDPEKTFNTNLETVMDRQSPDNPGIKYETASTYGLNIPVSIGQRFVAGNIIDASKLVPRLVGYREYFVDVKIYPEPVTGPL